MKRKQALAAINLYNDADPEFEPAHTTQLRREAERIRLDELIARLGCRVSFDELIARLGDRFESLDKYPDEWVVGVRNAQEGKETIFFEGESAVDAALKAIRELQREKQEEER